MLASKQIMSPEHWQDFENLCKKLWGEIWNCSDTIQNNGRLGQNQSGVDIYGIPSGEVDYYGIQCKCKNSNINSGLTTKEIDEEIKNAKDFKPQLKALYFTTTAANDAKIQEYVRIKNVESLKNGGFAIHVFFWDEIVEKLKENRNTYNWYVNNYQYIDNTNIELCIDGGEKFVVRPEYIRKIITYKIKPAPNTCFSPEFAKIIASVNNTSLFYRPSKKDYRWCDIALTLKNTGSTTIEDYKLTMVFYKTQAISDKFGYYDPFPLMGNSPQVAQINAERVAKRELYESNEYSNVIELRPVKSILVEDDHKTFNVGVKPKDDATEVVIKWSLKSRGYSKDGELRVKIVPSFTETTETIYVKTEAELKPDKEVTEPKIIVK